MHSVQSLHEPQLLCCVSAKHVHLLYVYHLKLSHQVLLPSRTVLFSPCVSICFRLGHVQFQYLAWSTYAAQEKELNGFHLRCLGRIIGISLQDRVANTDVLERAGPPSIFTPLSQRRLRWLGHVRRMDDGRIPKDLLYGELASGARSKGRSGSGTKILARATRNALQ